MVMQDQAYELTNADRTLQSTPSFPERKQKPRGFRRSQLVRIMVAGTTNLSPLQLATLAILVFLRTPSLAVHPKL